MNNFPLKKYIVISGLLHFFFFYLVFEAQPRMEVFLKKGISVVASLKNNILKKNQSKKLKEKILLDRQKNFRVNLSSFFIPEPSPKKTPKKKPKETENQKAQIGALYQKANNLAQNNPPLYPYLARKMGYQGVVELKIEILTSGTVGKVLVTKSSGFPILDDSALKAVKEWIFFTKDNLKLKSPVKIEQKIRFMLE
jgi:TonB family protein